MEGFRKRFATLTAIVGMGMLLLPFHGVSAAPLKGYESLQVTATGKVTMAPGESKQVSVQFQNIGTQTWTRDTGAFVSVYTYGPKYRTSVFQDASWYKADEPAKLTEATVKPGETGHITFTLKAPKTAGTYSETFNLAAEDVAWIPGGQFTVAITVSGAASSSAAAPSVPSATSATTATAPTGLSGMVLLKSAKKLTAKANQSLSYTVGIKNTGTLTWKTRELSSGDLQSASEGSSAVVATKSGDTVAPGALDLITFSVKAPATKGTHTVSYHLSVDGAPVPDLEIDIPVEVTTNAPSLNVPSDTAARPSTSSSAGGIVTDITESVDPTIRVALLTVDEETDNKVEVSCESAWKLMDGNGGLLAEMKKNESVEAFYKKDRYWYNRGKGLEKTSSYLRFVPDTENAVCTIENFDRTVTRKSNYPDNQFRNVLELRYNAAHDRTWMINELPMELYLRGLGETSNISHGDFQRALITVARTYAYSMWQHKKKHANEYYDISSYADDQVYKGYGQEARSPNIVAAVKDTAGVIVTYDNETAITPYFSRSDGRTRSWGDVWYGDIPYLQGVSCPCDKGKTLWGHGVGMSASEALCQANNGKNWKDIIKYFYAGIDLTKRWDDESS